MISIDDAWSILSGEAARIHNGAPAEQSVRLSDALGRVTASDVHAHVPLPPFDNSAMDGFAVRASDTTHASNDAPARLTIAALTMAGDGAHTGELTAGQAVAVMTGAPVPAWADAIVPVEQTTGWAHCGETIGVREPATLGAHIRRAGEDIPTSSLLVPSGTRITPTRAALLSAAGVGSVNVYRRPRVAIAATGAEVVNPPESPGAAAELNPGQVFDANRILMRSTLNQHGLADVVDLGIVGDEPDAVDAVLGGTDASDLLVLSGGVSVGMRDIIQDAIVRAGGTILFWKVSMKPGKPLLAARIGSCIVVGLPGNPVSCATALHVFVAPLLRQLSGLPSTMWAPWTRATVAEEIVNSGPRDWLPTLVTGADDHGALRVRPTATQGSHRLRSLSDATHIGWIPAHTTAAAGSVIRVLRLAAASR